MLTIWGKNRKPLCDGLSRREFLQVGTLGVGGLTLADLLRLRASGAQSAQPSRKSVIMIYLCGAPPHMDMYDMKPEAPVEYRGEFAPISTNVPGLDICELMPLQAKIADKLAIVRNLRALATNTHMPDAGQATPQRSRSTTPIQALNLFNSRFVASQATEFAARVQREVPDSLPQRIEFTFRAALGRDPTAEELRHTLPVVKQHGLSVLCRVLFNSNEFLFIP